VYDFSSSDHNDDVSARSRFAAWHHEDGEDAVYVAWHTNAFNASATGTFLYVYGPNPPDGTYNFTGTPGSDVLAQHLQTELIGDIRQGWNEPTWKDRGIDSAYFGELNPSHNNEMPAVLLEVAFHDAAADAAHLKEPRFRYVAARAIAQGITRYFAEKDAVTAVLSPEPPTALSVRNTTGGLEVRWRPPELDPVGGDAPTSYRVYSSTDGLSWDEGEETTSTSVSMAYAPGTLRYFRITSVNAGGESFPSPVVGAAVAASGSTAPVLVVTAFDRLDALLGRHEDLSAFDLGSPLRAFVHRMNDGNYLRRHGDAIVYSGVAFDGASADAVTAGDVTLSAYTLVDWFSGRGHANGKGPTTEEQDLLRAFLKAGKGLLFSSSGAVAALASGSAADKAFLTEVLQVGNGPEVGTLSVEVSGGGLLDGMSRLTLDDGTKGAFPAGSPDVLTTTVGEPIALYAQTTKLAGISVEGPAKVVTLGFPFEAIVSTGQRAQAMGKLLKFFGLIEVEPPTPPIEEPPIEVAAAPSVYPYVGGCGCGTGAEGGLGLLAALVGALARRRARRPNKLS
jgi:MYXO-CTERM domain-containing protein